MDMIRIRRPLTPAEQSACEAFRRLLVAETAKPDRSQEKIASEIGLTQGAIWQWADGRIPIPARRARAAAKAVGGDPGEISVAYREIHSPEQTQAEGKPEARHASHLVLLDEDTLHEALTLLVHDEDHAGPYAPRAQTARLAELYARVAADGGRLSKQHNAEFAQEVQSRAEGKGVVHETKRAAARGRS